MISIIIPAHNEEDYIVPTIESILKQTERDVEIIVVLDGCTDNTYKKINKKVDKVINIRDRVGPAKARNIGAKEARGEILVFLDADTQLQDKEILREIENTKEKWKVGTCKFKPNNNKLKHIVMYFLKNNLICPFGTTNGIIFCKKKDFEKIGGFNEKFKLGEDRRLVQRLKQEGKFKLLNKYVVSSTRRFDKKGYIKTMIGILINKRRGGLYSVIR